MPEPYRLQSIAGLGDGGRSAPPAGLAATAVGLAARVDSSRSAPAAGLAAALQHLPPRWRATRSQGAAALTAARRPAEARTPLVAYYCEHAGRCWRVVARGSGETLKLDDAASVLLPPDKITNSRNQSRV